MPCFCQKQTGKSQNLAHLTLRDPLCVAQSNNTQRWPKQKTMCLRKPFFFFFGTSVTNNIILTQTKTIFLEQNLPQLQWIALHCFHYIGTKLKARLISQTISSLCLFELELVTLIMTLLPLTNQCTLNIPYLCWLQPVLIHMQLENYTLYKL